MDIASRLERIELEIFQVEEEKLELEQRLGLFWEHPPALDPEAVGRAMQFLRNRIRGLENRKRALLQERQALIVQAVIHGRGRQGD